MSPYPIHLNLVSLLRLLLPFLMDSSKPTPNPNPNPSSNPDPPVEGDIGLREDESSEGGEVEAARGQAARRPFTDLSQVDADLALARTLQEQERAYMMLSMGGAGSDEGSVYEYEYEVGDEHDYTDEQHGDEEGSDYDDEDAFDVQEREGEIDPSAFSDDEAYARALQDAEERQVAVRLMALAGINDWVEDREDHGSNSQDTWQDVDPDDFSYEELVALGEAVGTESRGLSADTIASLPSICYKAEDADDENNDPCVICRLDYEEGDLLSILPCKHKYHSECVNQWLQINKACPVCSTEVSTSEGRR